MTIPVPTSNRSFGIVFFVFFASLGLYLWWRNNPFFMIPISLSALITVCTLLKPDLLSPFNRAWMKFGEWLHQLINPIILGVIFYGIITPYGVFMRLLERDVLRRKRQPELSSYWILRTPPGPESGTLSNQF